MLKQWQDALLVRQDNPSALSGKEDAWQAEAGTQLYDASAAPPQLILPSCRGRSLYECKLLIADVRNAITA